MESDINTRVTVLEVRFDAASDQLGQIDKKVDQIISSMERLNGAAEAKIKARDGMYKMLVLLGTLGCSTYIGKILGWFKW